MTAYTTAQLWDLLLEYYESREAVWTTGRGYDPHEAFEARVNIGDFIYYLEHGDPK